jgi:hypothetical protein
MRQLLKAHHEQIEQLAYQLWEERGGPFGSPDEDWFRAEWQLVGGLDSPLRLPFSSLTMRPVDYYSQQRQDVGRWRTSDAAH